MKFASTCIHFLPILPSYNKIGKSPNGSICYLLYTKCLCIDCCVQVTLCFKNFSAAKALEQPNYLNAFVCLNTSVAN